LKRPTSKIQCPKPNDPYPETQDDPNPLKKPMIQSFETYPTL